MNGSPSIRVRLNGVERDVAAGRTVTELLQFLDLRPELVVVERNREILERARYDHVRIEEGDALELVHFVGGG
jgi:thiamine biosynthesis protein ThiS